MSENKIVLIKEESERIVKGPYFGNLREGTIFQSAKETPNTYFYIKSGDKGISLRNGTVYCFDHWIPVIRLRAEECLEIRGRGDLDV